MAQQETSMDQIAAAHSQEAPSTADERIARLHLWAPSLGAERRRRVIELHRQWAAGISADLKGAEDIFVGGLTIEPWSQLLAQYQPGMRAVIVSNAAGPALLLAGAELMVHLAHARFQHVSGSDQQASLTALETALTMQMLESLIESLSAIYVAAGLEALTIVGSADSLDDYHDFSAQDYCAVMRFALGGQTDSRSFWWVIKPGVFDTLPDRAAPRGSIIQSADVRALTAELAVEADLTCGRWLATPAEVEQLRPGDAIVLPFADTMWVRVEGVRFRAVRAELQENRISCVPLEKLH